MSNLADRSRPIAYVYRGRTAPPFRFGLFDASKTLVDLTGATLTMTMRKRELDESESFDVQGDVEYDIDVEDCNVRVDWDSADTDREPGIYLATLEIEWADGSTQTEPYEPMEFRIAPPLDAA